jgi:biotin carboxylase
MRELIEWEYQLPGAADEFFNVHPGLDPAVVVPLQEYATPFAARLAERYGLPGAGSGAAQILRDKSLLRKVTRSAGIANPASEEARSPEEVRRFMASNPGPVVLKPANRQAAVGTKILAGLDEVEQAWNECVAQDEGIMVPDRQMPLRMLVESFVRGHEYSVEMLVRDGVPLFTNITDKVLYPGPRPIELGHVVPAELPRELDALLRRRTTEVLRAVGFGTGIVHCEWIVSDGVPYVVECAGRFAGDGIAELIERAYPIPLVKHFYTLMRGDELPPLPERAEGSAAVRFLQVEPGEVLAVDGVAAAKALPGVVSCSVSVEPGGTVRELRSSWDRVGSVMTCAPSAGEAMRLAEKAIEQIRVEVVPTD